MVLKPRSEDIRTVTGREARETAGVKTLSRGERLGSGEFAEKGEARRREEQVCRM